MSGTSYLTVSGSGTTNIHSGVLSIPSSLGTTVNSLLQTYLDGVSTSVTAGIAGFENYNAVTGIPVSVSGSGTNFLEEITNTDSVGASSGGSASGVVSVAAGVTDLVVQVPGIVSVDGVGSTTTAILGASSNVTYSIGGSVSNGTGSIFAAGGKDLIADYGSNSSYDITSAGNDSVVMNGVGGVDSVNAVGNATTSVFIGGSDVATVTASGTSKVAVVFFEKAGGSLYFVNSSSETATVFSGAYTTSGGGTVYAPNAVTAFGGAGGGYFFGGRGGGNYLDGGQGNSTLVGAGASDTLISGGADNSLYAGNATETLLGGGGTNSFFVGLEEVGVGTVQASSDFISAGGSASQIFTLGNVASSTLVGSTVTGAQNIYDVLGNYTTQGGDAVTFGGSSFTITDFGGSDKIFLLNGSYLTSPGAPTVESITPALGNSGSTQILLSDNTVITLKGVTTSHVNASIGGHLISYH
ncbi:MAG: hypothetical protein KGH91_00945 [Rhodospirillales bacterium]|nr:hypothetical protein [Rhodospirillales bacterium]